MKYENYEIPSFSIKGVSDFTPVGILILVHTVSCNSDINILVSIVRLLCNHATNQREYYVVYKL